MSSIGVLLCQVGSPAAPTAEAVRPYLKKFLSDPHIIDYPSWLWQPILSLILLSRPRRSAALYQKIWTPLGSPLTVYSQQVRDDLQKILAANYTVELGLAYTATDIAAGIHHLHQSGCQKILLLPLFPQYSTTTTLSAIDDAQAALQKISTPPTLKIIPAFGDDRRYQTLLSDYIKPQLPSPRPDFLLISCHGIPLRYEKKGDPYRAYCKRQAAALAHDLGYAEGQWALAFQSHFGPEKWIGPSTQKLLPTLPATGVKSIAVVALSFVTDCLETLEELACEGKELWEQGGGAEKDFYYIPCLNTHPAYINFLAELIKENAR